MKICFITKREKPGVDDAIRLAKKLSQNIDIYYGNLVTPFPSKIVEKQYDIIISYISPWVVPKKVLKRTKRFNINFHPGPPEYPGTGCFNFALFDSSEEFGVTAHLMDSKVDTGKIIGVKRFPIDEKETVESLSIKTYSALFSLYSYIIDYILSNNSLPECSEIWKRKPYTRRELESLATIKTGMSSKEIEKRIQATYYPGKPAPFIEIGKYRFEYNPDR